VQLKEKIVQRSGKAGLRLTSSALDGLETYFELLRKWNRKVSLTALPVEDAGDEAVDRLLIEPILAVKHLPRPDASMIDIGSGGGSPAIPMKVIADSASLTMVESKTRKAAFLREAVRIMDLTNVWVEACRFEELLARPELHESADAVTIRAVRLTPSLLAALQSFVKPGGSILMFGTAKPGGISPLPGSAHWSTHSLHPSLGSQLLMLSKAERLVSHRTGSPQ
jgi:16S rRNA (guanine527-N7)-methyltransferase